MKAALFWRLPVHWQTRWLRAAQWWQAHTPHEHHWTNTEFWSSKTGWVSGPAYCSICGKRRKSQA